MVPKETAVSLPTIFSNTYRMKRIYTFQWEESKVLHWTESIIYAYLQNSDNEHSLGTVSLDDGQIINGHHHLALTYLLLRNAHRLTIKKNPLLRTSFEPLLPPMQEDVERFTAGMSSLENLIECTYRHWIHEQEDGDFAKWLLTKGRFLVK